MYAIARSPDIHPVIMSGYGPVEWCPASMGINAPCANMPPGIGISEATVVFSDLSFRNYNSPAGILELLGEDVYAASLNLAQTLLAAVRIDLGNRNPNNFLFNLSLVDATLFKKINSSDSVLYSEVLKQVDGKPESASALVPGPATIQRVYSCNWQVPKPVPSAVISVMVATITMFMTGWQIVMVLVAASRASTRNPWQIVMFLVAASCASTRNLWQIVMFLVAASCALTRNLWKIVMFLVAASCALTRNLWQIVMFLVAASRALTHNLWQIVMFLLAARNPQPEAEVAMDDRQESAPGNGDEPTALLMDALPVVER